MASEWEEKFRAELREAFESVSKSSQPVQAAPTVPSPLLAKWQQIGYEKLNETYLVLSQTVDDLRTTAACGFDGMLTSTGLDTITDAFDWLDACDALHRLPALVVIRAACLDVLRAYALRSDPTIPRTPLQKMVKPSPREELIPVTWINEAEMSYKIPLLGKQHGWKRTPSRHGRAT